MLLGFTFTVRAEIRLCFHPRSRDQKIKRGILSWTSPSPLRHVYSPWQSKELLRTLMPRTAKYLSTLTLLPLDPSRSSSFHDLEDYVSGGFPYVNGALYLYVHSHRTDSPALRNWQWGWSLTLQTLGSDHVSPFEIGALNGSSRNINTSPDLLVWFLRPHLDLEEHILSHKYCLLSMYTLIELLVFNFFIIDDGSTIYVYFITSPCTD